LIDLAATLEQASSANAPHTSRKITALWLTFARYAASPACPGFVIIVHYSQWKPASDSPPYEIDP